MTDHSTEALLRELLTGQARLETKVEALEKHAVQVPPQLEGIRGAVTSLERQSRADLNNSYDRLKNQLAEHDAKDDRRFDAIAKAREADLLRIDALERVKDQMDGAKGVGGFIAKHGGLLISIATAFWAALITLKEKLL